MIAFRYQLATSSPSGTHRPLVPIRIIGPSGRFLDIGAALLDTGSVDTIFHLPIARSLGVNLKRSTQTVTWRGIRYPLQFGDVDLELTDDASIWRWTGSVGFTPAPVGYPLLGDRGCLQFLDATFRGHARLVQIETNAAFPGTVI
jgi:hypothetical protein